MMSTEEKIQLTLNQMEMNLPNYMQLFSKIKEVRDEANKHKAQYKQQLKVEYEQYA